MLVNDEFKSELKHIFKSGYEEILLSGTDADRWMIKDKSSLKNVDEAEFYVLTMSSQLFRIIVLLHFSISENTRAFVSEVLNIPANNVDNDKFYDYLGEIGNSFLGSIKRDVGRFVPSLGMSTPNRLNKGCLKYLDILDSDFEAHAVAEFDDNELFYSSVYLIADEELNISTVRTNIEDETDSGDLEMF